MSKDISQLKQKEEKEELETNVVVNLEKVNPDVDHDPLKIPEISQPSSNVTQVQIQKASLLHVQTNQEIELPQQLTVIHLGKQNEKIPPDLDFSGFPDSQFVSRIHADIRVEGDAFYLEDTGSANGTYVNYMPLPKGNRHRLRVGDRIALGKEDKISFIFQLSS
jgi:pSer/pThr/pTyr-binding forkhead associated (FHA) protein